MKNRFKIGAVYCIIFTIFFVANLMFSSEVFASEYDDCINGAYHDGGWNSSSKNINHTGIRAFESVCNHCVSGDDYYYDKAIMGAWFNDSGNTNITASSYKNNVSIDGTETTVDIYLRAQAYMCGTDSIAEYFSNNPTAVNIKDIEFLHNDEAGTKISWLNQINASIILDSNFYDNKISKNTWTWPGYPIKIIMNVNGFKNDSLTTKVTNSDGSETYSQLVRIYSCPVHKGRCGSSYTMFEATVPPVTVSKFEGESKVGALNTDEWESTGWNNRSKRIVKFVENCENGCEVGFEHSLRKTAGSEKATYSIKRTTNYLNPNSIFIKKNGEQDFPAPYAVKEVRTADDSKVTIYPGQIVCEQLVFVPFEGASEATLNVCASALGEVGGASVSIKVRNNNVSKYNSYQKQVYAKPGDSVEYSAEYKSSLQSVSSIKPEKIQIDNGALSPSGGKNTSLKLPALFNNSKSSNMGEWKNAVSVFASSSSVFLTMNNKYSDDVSHTIKPSPHVVTVNDTGSKLTGHIQTNANDVVKTTPSKVTFVRSGEYNVAKVSTSQVADRAVVLVPYNYSLDAEVTSNIGVVYAGETASNLQYSVKVLPKTNAETTNGTEAEAYATKTGQVKVSTIYFTSGVDDAISGIRGWGDENSDPCSYFGLSDGNDCGRIDQDERVYNSSGNTGGAISSREWSDMNVPDVEAGSKFCVAVAVYPASSGADTNMDASGDGKWAISDSKCYTVAKRPSFQIWGGSMYINGNAISSVSTKTNLAGVSGYKYSLNDKDKQTVFGSWVEQSVLAGGLVSGLASGAATGTITLPGTTVTTDGSFEGKNTSYCKNRVPLSIANYSTRGYGVTAICNNNGIGSTTGRSGIVATNTNKSSLIDYLTSGSSDTYTVRSNDETVDISSEDGYSDITSVVTGKTIRYTEGAGNLTIVSSDDIPGGVTHLVRANGTVTINSGISYSDEAYTSLGQVPKLLIYAKDIVISCNVTRVDAILIAENNVDTCKSGAGETINDSKNSNQLTINGTVISDTLTLNRTYGAATGVNSGIPAEIINYDSSMMLWAEGTTESDSRSGLNITSIRELAPRY